MSGNICRCGAYTNIVDAVRDTSHGKRAPDAVPQEASRGDARQARSDAGQPHGGPKQRAGMIARGASRAKPRRNASRNVVRQEA